MADHQVIVVGAGMAGLSCAVDCVEAGLDTLVVEASDAVGGRVRTDRVGGLLLDHGFQLLNPAYPALHGFVDLDALELQPFGAGVVVARAGRRLVLADPRRSARDVAAALSPATGSLLEKLRFARYAAATLPGDGRRVKRRPDGPYGEALDRAGVSGSLRTAVLEPFLAGVLGEDAQESSRVFVDLLLRTFGKGTPALPRRGIQALPEQLADRLPEGVLRRDAPVGQVRNPTGHPTVRLDDRELSAHCVVVATDGPTAAKLTRLPSPAMHSLTTYYHHTERSPAGRAMLHVDGDRRGPVVNSAVVSDVAREYCQEGSLVASTVLGANGDAATAELVRRQLADVYGADTSQWDLVATYSIPRALPQMLAPLDLRQPVGLGGGLFVAGDHRDTASLQGAIVSGRRTARAVARLLGADRGGAAFG